MNDFILIAVFVHLIQAVSIDSAYNYELFMVQFNRSYVGEERIKHQAIFDANLIEIRKRIAAGQDLAINKFMDWNQTQLKGILNYKPASLSVKFAKRVATEPQVSTSFTQFNWQQFNVVTSVKDQGSCGSCWAFATTAQYESLLVRDTSINGSGTDGTHYDLAEQYALECDNSSYGCYGGYPTTSLSLVQLYGIPLETTYPYVQSNDQYYKQAWLPICSNPSRIKLSRTAEVSFYSTLTTQQIEQDLITYGPLQVGVSGSSYSFQYAGPSGLINNCPTYYQINHVVLLYGYNSSHWFIKNSWGTSWGDNGHAYILKTNDCGIHIYVAQLRADFGQSPTPTPTPPTPTPPDPVMNGTRLTINMTDSYGDGWNGNIFGLKQNGAILATFGSSFTSGYSQSAVVYISNSTEISVVLTSKGSWQKEVGFVIRNDTTELARRNPGLPFKSTDIFGTFCPDDACTLQPERVYWLTLYDSFGDGWGASELSIVQNSRTIKITRTQLSNFTSAPIQVSLLRFEQFEFIFTKVDKWSEEIGYVLRDQNDTTILSKFIGNPLTANFTYGRACSDCMNYNSYFNFYEPVVYFFFQNLAHPGQILNPITLTIEMTDTYGDGWNGFSVGVKQNKAIFAYFGGTFNSGYSLTTNITIERYMESQLVVYSKGQYSEQIGFKVYHPNGTLLAEKIAGTSFLSTNIFATFCVEDIICLTLQPTFIVKQIDSWGDGWPGASLQFIRQNKDNLIYPLDRYQDFFHLYQQINLERFQQIQAKYILSVNTDEVGFELVDNSQSLPIFSRLPGNDIPPQNYKFCMQCPNYITSPPKKVDLIITMTDQIGDGWNNLTLGLKQNGQYYPFGGNFTNGYQGIPITFTLEENKWVSIVTMSKGSKSNQVGFTIRKSDSTLVYQWTPGTYIKSTQFFKRVCLSPRVCQPQPDLNYSLAITDEWGDGWNQNQLTLIQINKSFIVKENNRFKSQIMNLNVQRNQNLQLKVLQLGSWSEEVGFTLRDQTGKVVAERVPGVPFAKDNILATTCPRCDTIQTESVSTSHQILGASSPCVISPPQDALIFKILTFVLAGVCGVLLLASTAIFFILLTRYKEDPINKVPASLKSPIETSNTLPTMTHIPVNLQGDQHNNNNGISANSIVA